MLNQANASSPKLAPDGIHVAFSDIRTDAAELMAIATLQRTPTKYVVTDPRVLNPPAPTSFSDLRTVRWSASAALFEFKSFSHGGADATYVQVGGEARGNPDVWEVNLKTGARTRLTSYPDWDEDNESFQTNRSAPYLLVAHLVARRPTRPVPVVNSQPRSWAPSPIAYHGVIGSVGDVMLKGLATGTVAVHYGNTGGRLSGADSVTYTHYSDNGRDFLDGTYRITNTSILNGPVEVDRDLTMTGAHRRYAHAHERFSGVSSIPVVATGTATTSYDGTTVTGLPKTPAPCPSALPRKPTTRLPLGAVSHGGQWIIRAHVTATVGHAGPNERGFDTRPVRDAVITIGRTSASTNADGSVILLAPAKAHGRIQAN